MAINIKDGKRTIVAPIEWFPRPDGLERCVRFEPGYNSDHDPDPGKDYGVHGMQIEWLLRGPKGVAAFVLYTDWIPGELSPGHGLPPAGMELPRRPLEHYPQGAQIERHSRLPQYAGEEPEADSCPLLDGATCYYDCGYLAGSVLGEQFVLLGEPVIWAKLEQWYAGLDRDDAGA